jgi:hypothetical protein
MTVLAAFHPRMVREAMKDTIADLGMTEDDVRELVKKLESPAGKQ